MHKTPNGFDSMVHLRPPHPRKRSKNICKHIRIMHNMERSANKESRVEKVSHHRHRVNFISNGGELNPALHLLWPGRFEGKSFRTHSPSPQQTRRGLVPTRHKKRPLPLLLFASPYQSTTISPPPFTGLDFTKGQVKFPSI